MSKELLKEKVRQKYYEQGIQDDIELSFGEMPRLMAFVNKAIELVFFHLNPVQLLYLKGKAMMTIAQLISHKNNIASAIDKIAEELDL